MAELNEKLVKLFDGNLLYFTIWIGCIWWWWML